MLCGYLDAEAIPLYIYITRRFLQGTFVVYFTSIFSRAIK
jgi:hypothetical protein